MRSSFVIHLCCVVTASALRLAAQDYSALRINEVIAANESTPPRDVAPQGELGAFVDMVEIYNTGNEELTIGGASPGSSLALTDTESLPFDPAPYTFRNGTGIRPGQSIIVFCDGNAAQDRCEPHATFHIASDGTEPISLWGPVSGIDDQGRPIRELLDQVWLPPLPPDASFGRYPDGAGPAPVPLDRVLETYSFHAPGVSSFGVCVSLIVPCADGTTRKRFCVGSPNSPGTSLQPRVWIEDVSSVPPIPGEPLDVRIRVSDEKLPFAERPGVLVSDIITSVEAIYALDLGPEQTAQLSYDETRGIQHSRILTFGADGQVLADKVNPFGVWTEWTGTIPAQVASTSVAVRFRCVDADGTVEEVSLEDLLRTAWLETVDADHLPSAAQTTEGVGSLIAIEGTLDSPRDIDMFEIYIADPSQFSASTVNDGTQLSVDSDTQLFVFDGNGFGLVANDDATGDDELRSTIGVGSLRAEPGRFLIAVSAFDNDPVSASGKIFGNDGPTGPGGRLPVSDFAFDPDPPQGGPYRIELTGASFSVDLVFPRFVRSDCNGDGKRDISDPILTLSYLFVGDRPIACLDAADDDDNGVLEVTDAIHLLHYLFLGGDPPAPPFPACGTDAAEDGLGCRSAPACAGR